MPGVSALGELALGEEPTPANLMGADVELSSPGLYVPPTAVNTLEIPWLTLVSRADPDFNRRKYREVEYEFTGRNFIANPSIRGAYNENDN